MSWAKEPGRRPPNRAQRAVLVAVARGTGVGLSQILSTRAARGDVFAARVIATVLLKRHLGLSLLEVARLTGVASPQVVCDRLRRAGQLDERFELLFDLSCEALGIRRETLSQRRRRAG